MKISVCIPVYKVEAYIEKCARSLFEQTCPDMEFVFVDDCSPDGSLSVIERLLASYPDCRDRVKLLRHERNGGSAQARKTAMAHATGEWIGFCDADDWVDPDFFGRMVAAGEREDADMVFAPMCRNENGPMVGEADAVFSGTAKDYLNTDRELIAFHSTCNKIYRRAIATDADIVAPEPVGIGEDTCYMAQAVAQCRKVVSVTGVFYHYRENETSKTRKFNPRRVVDDLTRVFNVWEVKGLRQIAPTLMGRTARDIAFYGLKFGVMASTEYHRWMRLAGELLGACGLYRGLPLKRKIYMGLGVRCYGLARAAAYLIPHTRQKGI